MYLSRETQRLFARLYLAGLSSGDFEPAFRELLGERRPRAGLEVQVELDRLGLPFVWVVQVA